VKAASEPKIHVNQPDFWNIPLEGWRYEGATFKHRKGRLRFGPTDSTSPATSPTQTPRQAPVPPGKASLPQVQGGSPSAAGTPRSTLFRPHFHSPTLQNPNAKCMATTGSGFSPTMASFYSPTSPMSSPSSSSPRAQPPYASTPSTVENRIPGYAGHVPGKRLGEPPVSPRKLPQVSPPKGAMTPRWPASPRKF
jgi:hypothetical protein